MLASIARYLGIGLLALSSGCAICGSCDDETYGALGGRWERLDPRFGRVGSAFTPEVGQRVEGDPAAMGEFEVIEESRSQGLLPLEPTPAEQAPAAPASSDDFPAPPPANSMTPGAAPTADSSVLLPRQRGRR